jgi:hypothetical protein
MVETRIKMARIKDNSHHPNPRLYYAASSKTNWTLRFLGLGNSLRVVAGESASALFCGL